MKRIWIACPVILASLVLTPSHAFAQDDDATAKAKQADSAQQQLERARKQQEDLQKSQAALREFLNGQSSSRRIALGAEGEIKARFLEFRLAIPKLRAATDDYRWALGLEGKLEKPLKDMEAQTEVMLRYMSAAKFNHPRQDASEFKDYSQSELEWETLNTAEKIATFADVAVVAEHQENTVNAVTLEFLYKLEGELLRLKWLSSHVK